MEKRVLSVTVALEPALRTRLDEMAQRDRRSRSWIVRRLLEMALAIEDVRVGERVAPSPPEIATG